jgi:dihydrofolate reductase
MIGMIVACDLNGVIGYNNTIPWRNKTDLKRFRQITKDCVVVMGRKTWESLPVSKKHGVKLPGRPKYVLSRFDHDNADDTKWVSSRDEAINDAKENYPDKDIWIIGGSSIYQSAVCSVVPDVIDLTIVNFKWDEEGKDCMKVVYLSPISYDYMVESEVNDVNDRLLFHRRYVRRYPETPEFTEVVTV